MNFTLPKVPKILKKFQKRLDKNMKVVRKTAYERTAFLRRFKKAVLTVMHKIGLKIHDISPIWLRRIAKVVARPFRYIAWRIRDFMKRRPHRSFRLTRRRDYARSLKLPGYWAFTMYVIKMLWGHKTLFGTLLFVYTLLYAGIAGLGAQETYLNLSEELKAAGGELFSGAWGKVSEAGILLATTFSRGINPSPTQIEGLLMGIIALMTWLTVVWLLRNVMAGHTVKLRDGIYSSGSPIVATFLVFVVLIIQLLPVAVLILIYDAATLSGLLEGGVEAMLFWVVAILVVVGVLYWITSTIVALVIVTLPGMYPFQAISTAGDLVVGRRVRILLRIVWALFLTIFTWLVVAIPIIMLDSWFKAAAPSIAWMPIVPVVVLFLSALSILWLASYVYILYRKVVEDDAEPA